MTQMPTGPETLEGYDAPRNTQFSVFLDNRVGKLHELLEIFDGQQLRLVALSVTEAAEYAVVRVVTSRAELARRLLRRNGLPFTESDVLVVELGSESKLGHLCRTLVAVEVNIHYAYPLMVRPHGAATIALHTDDEVFASSVLLRKGFTLLGEGDLVSED